MKKYSNIVNTLLAISIIGWIIIGFGATHTQKEHKTEVSNLEMTIDILNLNVAQHTNTIIQLNRKSWYLEKDIDFWKNEYRICCARSDDE